MSESRLAGATSAEYENPLHTTDVATTREQPERPSGYFVANTKNRSKESSE
jgi:hypothetical protein